MRSKLTRPQTLGGIGEIVIAIALFLFEVFTGGIRMMWPFSPQIWVCVFLTITGIGLVLWGLIKKETPLEYFRNKYKQAHRVVPLLREMDRYLWSIADRYEIKGVNHDKFQQCGTKISALMNITTGDLDPNQSVNQWIEETKRILLDEKQQVEELLNNSGFEKQHQLMLSLTRVIDDEGFGLKHEKQHDRKYKRFKRKLEKYIDNNTNVVDSWVVFMSRYHVHKSEYFANSYYVVKCAHWITKSAMIPDIKDLVDIDTQSQLADIENASNERMEEIRTAIGDHIKELEKKEWQSLFSPMTLSPID